MERVHGTFFLRWSGNLLENHAWWVRLNLIWGAVFPSLGGEIYLALRKRTLSIVPYLENSVSHPLRLPRRRIVAVACLVSIVCALFWGITSREIPCAIQTSFTKYQDGDDSLYAVFHPVLHRRVKENILTFLNHPEAVLHVLATAPGRYDDYYFLASQNSLTRISKHVQIDLKEYIPIDGRLFGLFQAVEPSMQRRSSDRP